jgi:hypothetical protein
MCLLYSADAPAQLAPGAGYVFPPALQIGQTTSVQMGIFDPTDDLQWFVHHPKVQLERTGPVSDFHLPPPPYWTGPRGGTNALPIPREAPARITVAADAEPGFISWQIANANGSSRTARMLLSNHPEITEARSREFPQRLPALPIAVSGRLSRLTEVDRYEIQAAADGPISVELMARQLGADFRGVLEARDAEGRLLADFADTLGMDGGLTFPAKAGQIYQVSLHDVDFRGDRAYIYRLKCTSGPRPITSIPARIQRGTAAEVEFIGDGLMTGSAEPEVIRQSVTAAADPAQIQQPISLNTGTAATSATAFLLPLSDIPELVAGTEPLKIPMPGAATGRLTPEHSEQRIRFDAVKDQPLQITLQSLALGSNLDTHLSLLAPDGKPVADNDDEGGITDSFLELKPAVDGEYTCVIRSQSPITGRADEVYRLEVRAPAPGFTLQAPQQLLLPLAGQLETAVTVRRIGGFDGPITIQVMGLPEGVTAEGDWTIPAGKSDLKGILKCAPDSLVTAVAVQFRGTADVGGTQVSRAATASAAGLLCPRTAEQRLIETSLLSITMTPPIDVLVIDRERQRDVPRGSTCLAELEIVRKDGFSGPVTLVMNAQQARNRQGIRGTTTVVPANETRALFPCFMPEWLATDITRRMVVHGIVEVADPKGRVRQLTKPGDARITMIMEGALLKLACDKADLTTSPGATVEVPFNISRSPRLQHPVTVTLQVPEEAAELLRPEPLELQPEQLSGVLRIHSVNDPRIHGPWHLRLTASTTLDGRWPVISESEIVVDFGGRPLATGLSQ